MAARAARSIGSRYLATRIEMNFKYFLAIGTIVIAIVSVSQLIGGYVVDESEARKHAAIIVAEIERILGHGIGKREEGRLVKPGGVWLTARLPARGYGPDAYSDLGETMKLNGWSALPDKPQVYCKNGTMAMLRSAENAGEKSSVVVVDFEFSSLSLSRCGKPKGSDN